MHSGLGVWRARCCLSALRLLVLKGHTWQLKTLPEDGTPMPALCLGTKVPGERAFLSYIYINIYTISKNFQTSSKNLYMQNFQKLPNFLQKLSYIYTISQNFQTSSKNFQKTYIYTISKNFQRASVLYAQFPKTSHALLCQCIPYNGNNS